MGTNFLKCEGDACCGNLLIMDCTSDFSGSLYWEGHYTY